MKIVVSKIVYTEESVINLILVLSALLITAPDPDID